MLSEGGVHEKTIPGLQLPSQKRNRALRRESLLSTFTSSLLHAINEEERQAAEEPLIRGTKGVFHILWNCLVPEEFKEHRRWGWLSKWLIPNQRWLFRFICYQFPSGSFCLFLLASIPTYEIKNNTAFVKLFKRIRKFSFLGIDWWDSLSIYERRTVKKL